MISLAFAALCGGLALHQGFKGEFVVQDDARQHVFWMQRFVNPSLFYNDVIADYFQSIAPIGYSLIYQIAAFFKIDPLVFNKLLPFILGLITTGFAYRVTLKLLPIPLAGFLATLLLNQSLWLKDDLVSGTSRAFAFPLFLAVLEGILSRSPRMLWSAIALQGLICPSYALISGGLVALRLGLVLLQKLQRQWQDQNHPIVPKMERESGQTATATHQPRPEIIAIIQQRLVEMEQQTLGLYAGGLCVLFLALLPVVFLGHRFGPVVSANVAQTMPEFLSGGRTNIFDRNWLDYWFFGRGTNLIPRSLLTPVTLVFGLLLPVFLWKPIKRWLPLGDRVTPNIHVLSQLGIVSIGWFLLAHWLLFKLHLPSRYTGHSFRIIIAIAAGIGVTILIDALLKWMQADQSNQANQANQTNHHYWFSIRSLGSAIGLLGLGFVLLGYPFLVPTFPANSYHVGREPALYQFLKKQPIDSQIASLSSIGDDLPTFTGRSILTAKEYAVPYHLGYYRIFRERVLQTIQAQYSMDLWTVKFFLGRYHINFWLIDRAAFSPDYLQDSWLEQYPEATETALALLKSGQQPIVQSALQQCAALEGKTWLLLDAKCLRLLSP